MTPDIKHIGLALVGVIFVAGLLAIALGGEEPTQGAVKESSETVTIRQMTSTIPAIDAAAPAVVETATLALG